jgi:5'-phosphate synthase pdxT subunit
MIIGILALQGDVAEHRVALVNAGVRQVKEIRNPLDLEGIDGLIIPGGESTTISMLCISTGLDIAIQQKIDSKLPVYGSCAGMIMLATEILDGRSDQFGFKALDIAVRRNGFGRQVDSLETEVTFLDGKVTNGVFIRAPRIESVGPLVEVLATIDYQGRKVPVAVKAGNALATAYHPELDSLSQIHSIFVQMVQKATERV